MLLVLILPDEQFAKTTVVLVNKVLIIAYDIKQQTTIITLRKTNRIKPETHSYSFFPFDIYIQGFVPEARAITKYIAIYFCLKILNCLASGCFREFSEKKTPKRTWLCAGISPIRYTLQTR